MTKIYLINRPGFILPCWRTAKQF